jgi:hypothetical protein
MLTYAAWQHERSKDAERYAAREREWEAERRAHVLRVDADQQVLQACNILQTCYLYTCPHTDQQLL